jgi:hypothetical protein
MQIFSHNNNNNNNQNLLIKVKNNNNQANLIYQLLIKLRILVLIINKLHHLCNQKVYKI